MQRHFLGPAWRWLLAEARASGAETGPIDPADDALRDAILYLRQRARVADPHKMPAALALAAA